MELVRTTDTCEAQELLSAGARLRRLAHDMALELTPGAATDWPEAEGGPRLERLAANATELALASAQSTPPGHVDHFAWGSLEARVTYWEKLLAGQICGPLLPQSAMLSEAGGRVVGAAVLTRLDANAWWPGGPRGSWPESGPLDPVAGRDSREEGPRTGARAPEVRKRGPQGPDAADGSPRRRSEAGFSAGLLVAEIFVVPARQGQGLGGRLLAHVSAGCAAAGQPRIGLTVTDANPAERLYERAGFRRIRSVYMLEVGG